MLVKEIHVPVFVLAVLWQCFTKTMATLIICYQLSVALRSYVEPICTCEILLQPRKLEYFTKANH